MLVSVAFAHGPTLGGVHDPASHGVGRGRGTHEQHRNAAYKSLITELDEWKSAQALEDEAHEDLCDAAEASCSPARETRPRSRSRARARPCSRMLALDELDEQNASWLLDALLSCGPRIPQAMSDAA